MTTYCQANPNTRASGQQLTDRSAFLPFGTNFMSLGTTPTVPVEWSQLSNQAVFSPTSSQATIYSQAFNQTVNGENYNTMLPMDNGFGTWAPNETPTAPSVPTLNTVPTKSSGYWMIFDPPFFQMQQGPSCQNGSVFQEPGFTALCSDGTNPTCNTTTGEIQCSNTALQSGFRLADPLAVANKYVPAMQQKMLVNQESSTNKGDWTQVAYDMAMCNGLPCGCFDSSGNPQAGHAPLVTANAKMTNGVFSYPQNYCANGVPTVASQVKSTMAAPKPIFMSETGEPLCPIGLVPACSSSNAQASLSPNTYLYPVCNLPSGDGSQYMLPPLCGDGSVPVWNSTINAFSCDGKTAQLCPDKSTPIPIISSQCSDKSAPVCVTAPVCPSSGLSPTVPPGYDIVPVITDTTKGTWGWVGQPQGPGNQVTPTCGHFGVKTTDVCSCNCIVDSLGAPVAEGLAIADSQGIRCPDPNTKMNCKNPAVFAVCADNGVPTSIIPLCSDGSRPTFDTATGKAMCGTDEATCPDNLQVQGSGVVCTDTPALEPVKCFSAIAGSVCVPHISTQPTYPGGVAVCPEGTTLSCPGSTDNPITISSVCNGGMKPMCIPSNTLCTEAYGIQDFGIQAVATPIDTNSLSNQSILFCSSESGKANSCNTIFQSYFPLLDGPLGSQIQAGAQAPLLLPDPVTAGVLAQGVCFSAGNFVPNQQSEFTCASATNPPTALQNWNSQGEGSMAFVPVGAPFPLQKVQNAYPTEVYFQNQPNTGTYDSGFIYYLNQTCSADSTGTCTATHASGVPMAQGVMECPRAEEGVHVTQSESDKINRFQVRCRETDVKPLVVRHKREEDAEWCFPTEGVAIAEAACPMGKTMVSLDSTERLEFVNGVWRGAKTERPAVCVPTEKKDKAAEVVGASVPNQPCMNQPGIAPGVDFPGVGTIGKNFTYNSGTNTCNQNPVCANGECESNIRAESRLDYHQGLTLRNHVIDYPVIYQTPNTFPTSMFADLGTPGAGQRFNPMLKGWQPELLHNGQGIQESKTLVPKGFNYWPISTEGQGKTEKELADIVYNANIFGWPKVNRQSTYNGFQDSTGAGWDTTKYSTSTGNPDQSAEYSFAPAVVGPMMSGAMAEGNTGDRSNPNSYFSGSKDYTGNLSYSLFPASIQYQSMGSPAISYSNPTSTVDSWLFGFTRCDPCDLFLFSTIGLDGGNSPVIGSIPPFMMGNVPGETGSCPSNFFDVNLSEPTNINSCMPFNRDNGWGTGFGSSAPSQCRCRCGGQDFISSDDSWQGTPTTDSDYPDNWCTPSYCQSTFSQCQSTDTNKVFADAMSINSNQIYFDSIF